MSLGTVTLEEVATSTDVFAICKAADVLTTIYALEHVAGATEANPIIAATLQHGYLPLIAISVGIWLLLKEVNDPTATAAANAVTCGVAAHNFLLIQ